MSFHRVIRSLRAAALLLAAKLMSPEEAKRVLEVTDEELKEPNGLKKAYRAASVKHHPDRGGDAEMMKRVNEAYEVLEKYAPGKGEDLSRSWWEAHRAKEDAQRKKWGPIVAETIERTLKPDAFSEHFERCTGKVYSFTQNPKWSQSYANHLTWTSQDGETVFSLDLWVSLDRIEQVRALGSEDSPNLVFNITINQEIVHEGRKSKMKPRDWGGSSRSSTLMDPEELFPAVKLKKMAAGKEKARAFSRRDMILGLEKYCGAVVDKREKQEWAIFPVGKPVEGVEENKYFRNANRIEVHMYRTVMSWRGTRSASWQFQGVYGPRIKGAGRESYGTKFVSAEETEELLRAIVAAKKKTDSMSDGKAIARIFQEAFRKEEAEQADAGEEAPKPARKPAPAPIDFG